jgi:hypothetical protein
MNTTTVITRTFRTTLLSSGNNVGIVVPDEVVVLSFGVTPAWD